MPTYKVTVTFDLIADDPADFQRLAHRLVSEGAAQAGPFAETPEQAAEYL